MNPSLANLQRSFQAHVLRGQGEVDQVAGDELSDAQSRLNVYAQAYRLRLLEVLGNDFPGLKGLIGTEGFDHACGGYIDMHPSRHFNARWYGAGLPEFLRTSLPWSQQPALAEMATFEWALTLVFDAEDEPCVTEANVAAIAPENWPEMQPRLLHAAERISLAWNTTAIRKSMESAEAVPASRRLESPQQLLIWRRERDVRYRALETDEAAAIDALGRGASFADICDALCQWHADDAVAMRAAELLKRWITECCLRELHVPGDDNA